MWLGDITYGDTTVDPNATPPSQTQVPPDNPYVSLAANLIDMIHPYKQGVPVIASISPQTQNFLVMGGVLLGGLFLLGMLRK